VLTSVNSSTAQARDVLTTLLAAFVEKSNRYRDELARMSPS
jgi:hypothetical protein